MAKVFECGISEQPTTAASGFDSVVPGLPITASVGRGGVNRGTDVSLIQGGLNLVPSVLGGPGVKLMLDGLSGPRTEQAIYGFQVRHFGAHRADARVDPGFRTVQALESSLTSSGTAATARKKIVAGVPMALVWIVLAQKALGHALAFLGGDTSAENEVHFDVVDRCFKLRTVNNVEAKASLRHILGVFGQMQPAIARLLLFNGIKAASTCKPKVTAEAVPGGFHDTNPAHKVIAYCPARIAAKNQDDVTDVIVHELAHFVGPIHTSPRAIRHGGVTPPAYGLRALSLSHGRSLISASNYAWLAWLVRLPRSEWMTNKG